MAISDTTRFFSCPHCHSRDIREAFRMEAGEIDNEEDFAVYECNTCGLVFDYITHPKTLQGAHRNA